MDCISHNGIVDKIEKDKIFVKIVSKSACANCHAKGSCHTGDISEKVIEIKNEGYNLNENSLVSVELTQSLGFFAVFLGYIFPLIILVSSIIIMSLFFSETTAGLLSITVLLPYYFILHIFKNKLNKTFLFKIKENL